MGRIPALTRISFCLLISLFQLAKNEFISENNQTLRGNNEIGSGRQEQIFGFTENGSIDVDVGIFVPVEFIIPTFRWSVKDKRRNRSWKSLNHSENENTYDDINYAANLQKLDIYFHKLNVDQEVCRRKVLCEFSLHQEDYHPISTLFINQLRVEEIVNNPANRFYTYVKASEDGRYMDPSLCSQNYPCELHISYIKNSLHLHAWKFLCNSFNMRLTEES